MQQFRNVLVGVDLSHADRICTTELSAPAQYAVERAIWLGRLVKAQVTFFAALDVSPQTEDLLAEDFEHVSRDIRDAAEEVLAELVSRAKQDGVAAQSAFTFGKPWREIIRRVISNQHDLVVVSTRDLGAASRLLFGSTAMKLLRKCPCPVWVTKPAPEPDVANILVPSDLTDVAAHALDVAVSAGQLMNARLHVLHAAEFEFEHRVWLTGVPQERLESYRKETRSQSERELQEQLAATDYRTLTHGVQIQVVDGPADQVILQTIEEQHIDLLVMGTAARTGFPGLLIGNTAERLLPELSCSILAVKPADFVCPVSVD